MERSVSLLSWQGSSAVDKLSHKWGWVMALGIALTALGVYALGYSVMATLVSVFVLGYFVLIGGLIQVVTAFWVKEWSGFFFELLLGIFGLIVGYMMLSNPLAASTALTLLLGVYFMVEGIFRVISALVHSYRGAAWGVLSGIISLALGVIIYQEWPFSSLWLLGTFLAIRLIFSGISTTSLALVLRKWSKNPVGAA